jgi:hypothetical protein
MLSVHVDFCVSPKGSMFATAIYASSGAIEISR